ncbi:3-methyl-2-oxobutanoate dehydrogenase subunit VorB [bacterium]|nr:3-methyl-2-oxobutanoate dehydrogenase subunit VorB [bacterium]MBQ9149635.1 3-methyl-2-oxobutanoate dehydrogenase subunit VorB [bacterium]
MSEKILLKGNIAIAKAAINCGCSCYFGYPITPQTEIGEYLSSEMQNKKLAYVCAESEVAAINMALGAASSGAKVMTSSSSCAVSLMQEALSYASSDELPIVLVNVMRAGPGQGYIFPSQGDYNQAITGGGNGDYKTIVLSPSTVQECIELTYKAFHLAQKYRTPTILLVDGLLGQMAEPATLDENPYPQIDNSSWVLDGAKNRPSRSIHSLEPDQNKLNKHIFQLHQKYQQIELNEVDYEEYKCDDAEFIITAFGTMARSAKAVCDYYRERGIKFGVFRPKTLYPFPYKRLSELSCKAKLIIDIEMNLGQMLKDVRLAVLQNAPISFIGKPVGDWLKLEEITRTIDTIIKGHYAASI